MTPAASRSAGSRLPCAASGDWLYAVGLGGNRRHGRHGSPGAVLAAAAAALDAAGLKLARQAPTIRTPPLGPGGRCYANSAILVRTRLAPPALLALLKRVEREFGRRPGRRWGARVLDLDILLWSGGSWADRTLVVPHARLGERRFVLDPLASIVPGWPVAGALRVRHLRHRLTRPVAIS